MSSDITFCDRPCANKECKRHISRIPWDLPYASHAIFAGCDKFVAKGEARNENIEK